MDKSHPLPLSFGNSHSRYQRYVGLADRYSEYRRIGITTSGTDASTAFFDWFGSMGTGITGMGELIITTLLAGGMLEIIRYNGGINFIIFRLTRHVKDKRGAELSIAALVSIANLCTANNTIAIITTGPIAKEIALRFQLDRRKTASILDTFSCLIQGIIPYGAQLLIAAGLTGISPHQHHWKPVLSVYDGNMRVTCHTSQISQKIFLIYLVRQKNPSRETKKIVPRYDFSQLMG